MLGAKSLDVTATISMCKNKKDLIQHIQKNEDLYKIDETLGRLRGTNSLLSKIYRLFLDLFFDQKGGSGREREDAFRGALERLTPATQTLRQSIVLNKCAEWTLLLLATMTVSLLIVLAINLPIWAEVIFCLVGAVASIGLIGAGSVARAVSS